MKNEIRNENNENTEVTKTVTKKPRSGFTVCMKLIGLVKPLAGFMVGAVTMGLAGHLCASFITILPDMHFSHIWAITVLMWL